MNAIILAFITAFVITFLAIPSIIKVAIAKGLYDSPNSRSAHKTPTPALGGIGLFAGMLCAIVLWTPMGYFGEFQYTLAAFVILFLTGVQDDLLPMSPKKKLLGQLIASVILVIWSHLKITSLYGFLGLHFIHPAAGFFLSLLFIIGIINAFNLIDGINGLAGAIGLLVCLFLGAWFLLAGFPEYAVVSFSMAGALTAFMRYNCMRHALIFMGDTGSMLVGAVSSILAIKFMELNSGEITIGRFTVVSAPALVLGLLFLPVFDTLRVFFVRISLGNSPFSPDRNHIHHVLIDSGLTHLQATFSLMGINMVVVALVIAFMSVGINYLIIIEMLLGSLFSILLHQLERRGNRAEMNTSAKEG